MVTRGKARAVGLKKATMRVRPSVADGSEGLQQVTPDFEVVSTAVRKRKAEDSVNDKLAAMADAIAQLAMAQKEMTENHKALVESNTIMMETIKAQAKDIKTQGEEIKALRALIQEGVSQRTYSEAITIVARQ
jgi:predicted  nucleic acid-binding Zn-ribbon protein